MSQHIVSKKLNFIIFFALLALTFLTVKVASIDIGAFNNVVALTIAVIKALLVILYFMHVRYSNRLIWLFIGAGFFWLILLIVLTMSDFISREWLSLVGGVRMSA